MQILITKDSATVVSKEVTSLEEAKQYADNGFHVDVVVEDGVKRSLADVLAAADGEVKLVETVTYQDGTGATGVAPLPAESPATDDPYNVTE